MRVESDRYRKYIDNFDTVKSEDKTYTVESTMRGNDYKKDNTNNDMVFIYWDDFIAEKT